jgi:hypothetical protein
MNLTYSNLIALQERSESHLRRLIEVKAPFKQRQLAAIRIRELKSRMNGAGWQCSRLLTKSLLFPVDSPQTDAPPTTN